MAPTTIVYKTQSRERSAPEPKSKSKWQPKKQVRFALPAKTRSVRPGEGSEKRASGHTGTGRTSTRERTSKSNQLTDPIFVAYGLSTIGRTLDSKDKERSKPKSKSSSRRHESRSQQPPPQPARTKREHRSSNDRSAKRPKTSHNYSFGGNDWVSVKRTYKRVYV